MTDKIIVLTTCGSEDEARKIARLLVEERLAACVQVMPGVRSVYRWKNAIQEDNELLLLIKSRRGLFEALLAAVKKLHSYDVPEIASIQIVDGSAGYLAWMDRELIEGP